MRDGFIDIHCHILPGLDDGSDILKESLRMIALAGSDGTSGMVATPHVVKGVYDNTSEGIEKASSELDSISDQVRIYPGAEIRIDRDIAERLRKREIPLINGKNHILLELPAQVIPPVGELQKLILALRRRGIITILAHPERNIPLARNPSIMERLIKAGSLFQVTSTSITDPNLQGLAMKMIKKGYIHAVASDAHDLQKRPPILSKAFERISKRFGYETADNLFRLNPLKIIHGEKIAEHHCMPKCRVFCGDGLFQKIKKALP